MERIDNELDCCSVYICSFEQNRSVRVGSNHDDAVHRWCVCMWNLTFLSLFPNNNVRLGMLQKYLGEIPQVEATLNVVGNGNEHGLVIGESTFGGFEALAKQPGAIIDYGSLIYLTLQRAKTAREAIHIMADLMGR